MFKQQNNLRLILIALSLLLVIILSIDIFVRDNIIVISKDFSIQTLNKKKINFLLPFNPAHPMIRSKYFVYQFEGKIVHLKSYPDYLQIFLEDNSLPLFKITKYTYIYNQNKDYTLTPKSVQDIKKGKVVRLNYTYPLQKPTAPFLYSVFLLD